MNDQKNGDGKDYNLDDSLIFDGEYKNGLKWNGKGYNKSNNLVYELKIGKGYAKEYYFDRLLLEGEYLNGVKVFK